jgi:CheY-like chemotaxis protein
MRTEPLRVLVVDDAEDTARMLRVLLKGAGHEARIAFDGPGAIEAAAAFRPDVVLLDLTLPGMGGVEVAEGLRRLPGLAGCTIAVVTGYGEDVLPSPSPFDRHFLKPVDHDALLAYLASLRAAAPPRP